MICNNCKMETSKLLCENCGYNNIPKQKKKILARATVRGVAEDVGGGAITSFVIATVFVILGFYKMLIYAGEDSYNTINAYVGGDAYNYIINGTYATAFFVLATMFVIIGFGSIIVRNMNVQKSVIYEYDQE